MNAKKKKTDKMPDMTFINAAALQDHYLRTVNINIKPPSTTHLTQNRIVQKLKREQNNAILKNSANQILAWARQNSEQEALSAFTAHVHNNMNRHVPLPPVSMNDSESSQQDRSTNATSSIRQLSGTGQQRPSKNYIRIGHQKVMMNPLKEEILRKKPTFLPALPHEIDEARMEREEIEDQVKMAKYKNQLTLAQRLGIVAAPPKPLTRDDWVVIEEQSKKREEGSCPICLDDFKDTSQIILSCSHVFHKQCLESFEKHNKVKTCPICRREHYDKKQWDDGYKKYIVKCAVLIQKRWRGSRARYTFFTSLLERKYKATSVRMRRKILGYKLGKFNAKVTTAIEQHRKTNQQTLSKIDANIKKKIEEMYAQMNEIQALKQKNALEFNEFLGGETQQAIQRIPDYEIVSDAEKNATKRINQRVIMESEWTEIKNKALSRCDKDCAICFNNLYNQSEIENPIEQQQHPESKEKHKHDHSKHEHPTTNKTSKGLYILSCTHVFHANCISAFERYNLEENQVCPICRASYTKQHFVVKQ